MPKLRKGIMPVRRVKKRFARYGTTGSTGTVAELIVVIDLIKKEYEVFRAISNHCSCDLIAIQNGVPFKIEVKSGGINSKGELFYGGKRMDNSRFDILALVNLGTENVRYMPNDGIPSPN